MANYIEFEVSLRNIKPRIWRRFLLKTTSSFYDLHMAIQEAFGWANCHLFEFQTGGRGRESIAGMPDPHGGYGDDVPAARKVRLLSYFSGKGGERCIYLYDFGDGWEHDVKAVALQTQEGKLQRMLLKGARACPLEDCGGVTGYTRWVDFLATGVDPWDEDPEEARAWLGDWAPDVFDLDATKQRFDR